MGRKGRDGMKETKQDLHLQAKPEKQGLKRLNDFSEITIRGVTYRVKSVFSDKGQMGDLLDLVTMEKINRIA